MEKINKYRITVCILVGIIIILGVLFSSSSVKSNRLRAINDRLTERLNYSENTCRGLTETVGNCKSICGELDKLSERNIGTTRDAIEIIEETRYYVQSLEMELGYWDSDSIYNGIDNWLESEGIEFIH